MDSLEYSIEALEAKALFYGKQTILFVEGIDDPLFWDQFITSLNLEVHIEEVGGGDNLEKIIDKIVDEDANVYVAIDRDYIDFYDEHVGNRRNHQRILQTYGHSIENTLYHPKILNEVIKSYVRLTVFDETKEIDSCISTFESDVRTLLIYDILSNKLQTSKKVLGDSCMRHLKNSKSTKLCSEKIQKYIESLELNFSEILIEEINTKFNDSNKRLSSIIKGHFLTTFIINLIKSYVKKFRNKEITLNTDNLYSEVINKITLISNLDEYKHYINECEKINYA